MGYEGAADLLDEIVVEGSASSAAAGGVSAGTVAGIGAAGLAAGGLAYGASAGTATPGAVTSAASPTGPQTSANPGGTAAQPSSSFFGNAVKTALVGGAVNTGLTAALGGRRGGVNVPPPPGAAMVDPEGAQAAAMIRARQAVAGGLGSTVTGAGASQGAFESATAGGKSLLGQ